MPRASSFDTPEHYKPHPLDWVVQDLRAEISYLERPMFGCHACYCHGKLQLVLAAQDEEPWDGVMIATSKEHHASLLAEFSELGPHPVLGKWLYISQQHERFEQVLQQLTKLVQRDDLRLGVYPKVRKKRLQKRKPCATQCRT